MEDDFILEKKNGNGKAGETFFLAIRDKKKKKGNFIVYTSEEYLITEQEIIDLIKILYVNRRAVSLGRKVMAMYFDCTDYSPQTYENLAKIGIVMRQNEPEVTTNSRTV
jgi:hypothetical protein